MKIQGLLPSCYDAVLSYVGSNMSFVGERSAKFWILCLLVSVFISIINVFAIVVVFYYR